MSVINQMLKDLDQRSSEVNIHSTPAQHITSPYSSIKIALITAIVVLLFCSTALYIWQLNSENNALKVQQSINGVATHFAPVNKLTEVAEVNNYTAVMTESDSKESTKIDDAREPARVVNELKETPRIRVNSESRKVSPNAMTTSNVQSISNKPMVNNVSSKAMPAKKNNNMAAPDEHSHAAGNIISHSHNKVETNISTVDKEMSKSKADIKPKTSGMSVSRRQLSANELAQQKLALAEKALAAKQISKAEKLLEDVVIITPSDSQTRKKLAALWFGRRAYQDAVNLLSQGIALNGKDSSLRQMKARIHLQQGQATAALNTLKPLATLKDEQYQIMLANTAQQAQQIKAAVNAYTMLITMQPNMGRWQLGLAVLYDKNSQFTLATKAYKTALTKNDLSVSSEQFIKERIQAIGQ